MLEHHTAAPSDVTGADTTGQTDDTGWTPIALSGPIVGSRTGTGKTHASWVLLVDALAHGGGRG